MSPKVTPIAYLSFTDHRDLIEAIQQQTSANTSATLVMDGNKNNLSDHFTFSVKAASRSWEFTEDLIDSSSRNDRVVALNDTTDKTSIAVLPKALTPNQTNSNSSITTEQVKDDLDTRKRLAQFLALGSKTNAAIATFMALDDAELEKLLSSACVATDPKRPKNLDLKSSLYALVDIEKFARHADRRIVAERAVNACMGLPPKERSAVLQQFIAYIDRDLITGGSLFGGSLFATDPNNNETLFGRSPRSTPEEAPQWSDAEEVVASAGRRIAEREHLTVQWSTGDLLEPLKLQWSNDTVQLLKQREHSRASHRGQLIGSLYPTIDEVRRAVDTVRAMDKEYTEVRRRILAFDQVVADCDGLLSSAETLSLIADGEVGLQKVRREVDEWLSLRRQVKEAELMPLLVRVRNELQATYRDLESAKTVLALQQFVKKH